MWSTLVTRFLKTPSPDSKETLDLRLFMGSRNRGATDSRDVIYSLRGIAGNALSTCVTVDYSKSVERAYTDFAKNLLYVCPGLRVLSAVMPQHRKTSSLRLPSWVPD
jgi:hypothetical protein